MTTQEAVVVTWVAGDITPRLLTYKEAAVYIGMKDEGLIRGLVQQGRLPVVKVGTKSTEPRVDIIDLNRYIEAQKSGTDRPVTPHSRSKRNWGGERVG
jgi:excisionase family DNA binding protein